MHYTARIDYISASRALQKITCAQCIITRVSTISASLIYSLCGMYRLYQCFSHLANTHAPYLHISPRWYICYIAHIDYISASRALQKMACALIYALQRPYQLYQCFSRIAKNHMRTMYYNMHISRIRSSHRVDICVISPIPTISVCLAHCKKLHAHNIL